MSEKVISFSLTDPLTGKEVKGEIGLGRSSIAMTFDGYGDHTSQPGHGTPVFVEYYNGKLKLHVWDDINQEDPKSISLEGAREENYEHDQ